MEVKNKAENTGTALEKVISIVYLTPENATFEKKNDFIAMTATLPAEKNAFADVEAAGKAPEGDKEGIKSDAVVEKIVVNGVEYEKKTFERVFLHRAFPFDFPEAYISVLDADNKELGLITDLAVFDKETAELLRAELARKYYSPTITKINSIKERYGYSYWNVVTDEGELTFSLRDTYKSMLKIDGHRIIINDIDGNRYEIKDIEAMDHASFKKVELYL